MDRVVSGRLPRILLRVAQLQFPSSFAETVPRSGSLHCTARMRASDGKIKHHVLSPELRGIEILRSPHTNKVFSSKSGASFRAEVKCYHHKIMHAVAPWLAVAFINRTQCTRTSINSRTRRD